MSEVKDVFQRLLKDAPPMSRSAGEVLSTARGSRARRLNLLASGAAALAVVAIAGSVVLIRGTGGADQPGTVPPAQAVASGRAQATGAPEFPPSLPPMPLRFAPGWVPPGWAEHGRMAWSGTGEAGAGVAVGVAASRIWSANPRIERGEVKGDRFELSYRNASTGTGGGTPVDINGRPGTLLWDDGKSSVDWQIDGDTVVSVMQWGNKISEANLLRIARSVRPDPGSVNTPFRTGPVPAGFAPASLEISGRSPGSWHASMYVTRNVEPDPTLSGKALKERGSSTKMITVAMGTETLAPQGGQPTTVGGRPARYIVEKVADGRFEMHCIVVEFGNGLLLTVSSMDVGYEHLVQVAEGVTVEPAPDLAWIGPR